MATICAKKELPEKFKLREADAAECLAGGFKPEDAVRQSIALSDYYDVLYSEGEFFAAWGYRAYSLFSNRCQAWLLTGEPVDKAPQTFTSISLRALLWLFESFSEVEVLVHNEHRKAMRWLKWLGFEPICFAPGFTIMLIKRGNFKWVS